MRGARYHTLRWLREWQVKHGRSPSGSEVACARGLSAIADLAWMKKQGLVGENHCITDTGNDILTHGVPRGGRGRSVRLKSG